MYSLHVVMCVRVCGGLGSSALFCAIMHSSTCKEGLHDNELGLMSSAPPRAQVSFCSTITAHVIDALGFGFVKDNSIISNRASCVGHCDTGLRSVVVVT